MTFRMSEYLYGCSRDPREVVLELGRGGVEMWSSERVRVWAEHGGRAQQQGRLLLLGFHRDSQRAPTPWIPCPASQSVSMFDNSNYPFNCFNYDGDGYPTSSTDEEKKMCRPAYRYEWCPSRALIWPLIYMKLYKKIYLLLTWKRSF